LRLKILKKLRTASLNSEFTGSYKKKCSCRMHFRLNSPAAEHRGGTALTGILFESV